MELEPYRDMDKMMQDRLDYQMWMMGAYVTKAVSVAVDNVLNGKKSRSKYLERPFSAEEEVEQDPMTEFNRFTAWVAVYNDNFKKQNGQG